MKHNSKIVSSGPPRCGGPESVSALYSSPLGQIAIEATGGMLTSLRFVAEGENTSHLPDNQPLSAVADWLDAYFAGIEPKGCPPMQLRGTDFQRRVWDALLAIPYGQTISYGELAQRVGCRSAQAVGGAVGRNPVAIIVPCHRVVGADGSLTGYAYGLWRKEMLLRIEASH